MSTKRDLARGLKLGSVIALLGVILYLIPPVVDLEKDLGLAWMFGLRGPRPAPPEVVVVSIDNESSRQLGLQEGPSLWPRSLHAQLINKLNRYGARVIAFDVFFRFERDPQTDLEFAGELSKAGNVILFAHLNQRPVDIPNQSTGLRTILMEQLLPPAALMADSALSYAPFPLPKVPARVNQAWLFKPSSGDIPTLPVLALHHFAAPAFKELQRVVLREQSSVSDMAVSAARESDRPNYLSHTVRKIRQTLQIHPDTSPDSDWEGSNAESRRHYRTLRALHQGPNSHYIDFYGPPQSITTIPYYQVINAAETSDRESPGFDFNGKAVFVGNSEQYQPDMKDDFHTVFSEDSGVDLSGVEILATVFANLLEGRSIQPMGRLYSLGLVAAWGLVISVLFYLIPGIAAIISAVVLPLLYLAIAAAWFGKNGTWTPLVTPLLFQLPLALVVALLSRYLISHRERQRIQRTARYFLPAEVVDALPEWKQGDLMDAGRVVEGVCLTSDAESYASFAENIEPRELKNLLNRYFDLLFQPVRDRGGKILDVVGDSMLAFWEDTPGATNTKLLACQAAMEIQAKIAAASEYEKKIAVLPTRIGLHAGEVIVGNVGAGDHFEFRAVGDMINTTSRIEGLNKYLGTRVLASAQVADKVDGVVTRRVGKFRLKGKENHLEMFEVVCASADVDSKFFDLREKFLDGLDKFEAGSWHEAKAVFETIGKKYGVDGPSLFCLHMCEYYLKHGSPESWDGVNMLVVK